MTLQGNLPHAFSINLNLIMIIALKKQTKHQQ